MIFFFLAAIISLVPSGTERIPAGLLNVTGGCDTELSRHVYHPKRLVVLKPCIEVTGKLVFRRDEPDGDAHLRLELDPQFKSLLNTRNRTAQHGALVVEPICEKKPVQKDAIAVCRGVTGIDIPKLGTRVRVLGPYVRDDAPNHGWNEIHPPTSITVEP